ncbi:MAG: amino acid adenylation domain-containing protein [Aphanocapsa sp. GSE-SYN-MK-11-07L]|jgi:amino acid adenylation domain-containing protein|nr:amino acid adenylation domain-containing protein [Aphanocapsa sp. GSE-SYN-MK-11-07L]
MELHSLLTVLSSQSVKLTINGDGGLLEIDAPKGIITPELHQALVEHKPEIIELLSQSRDSDGFLSPPRITPAPDQRYEPFPLTDMQYAFWVGRSGVLELGDVANHGYYEIEGQNLDLERLNAALQTLIERHDMLRAIVLPNGQQQIQEIVPSYQMQVLDLRGKEEAVVYKALEDIRDCLSHQVIPADQWPLFEFRATLLDQDRVRLHISYDLQVFDAWSLFRLFDEWATLYTHPEVTLPPLFLSFRDYVLAEQALQNTELYARSRDYWLNRLDSLPPAPDLPLAKQPKELKQHRSKRYESQLEQTDWQQLKQRSTEAGLTPSGLLLAAFTEILTLWSKSPQFTVNLALFNRLPLHPQVNDILGDFTSVTLLAIDHAVCEPFTERAVRLQKQLWQDLEHRYFSGVQVTRELARRKGSAPSAIPIIFTSTLGFRSLGQETLTFSHFGELVYGVSQASQAWIDVQVWEEKETLTFNWDVVEDLFPPGMIDDMFRAYEDLLKQLAISATAWTELRRLLLPAQLAQRNSTNTAPVPDSLLHLLFTEQVTVQPNAQAIASPDRTLTYQEVYELSNQLGHKLRSLGATPNTLVAVMMEKGWEQIIAILGILAAGAAYVPIDPELPQARLNYLLENSEAKIVLTQAWLSQAIALPEGIHELSIESAGSESTEPLAPIQTPDDLAYVIYTSGSTGLPKGVMISHRAVVNTVIQTNQSFNVGATDRVLALTALSHDLSVYDIFGLLAAGGTIVLPTTALQKDPAHWIDLMARETVTLWNSVPMMMEMLLDYADSRCEGLPQSLRLTFLGGDWVPLSLPSRLQARINTVHVVSIGGPTETTIWNIWYPVESVDPTWTSIPYGQPIANTTYYILNETLEDCPTWVPGELCCAGVGLAKGYWRNPEKTQTSFITHPYTGERIYRTGDLGRYRPDGTIEFLGRVDFQIKIGGHRIEAGEIETALTQHSSVRSAVIVAIGEHHQARLIAYVVPEPQSLLKPEDLHDFLSQTLPAQMVPSAFVFLEAFPLSVNGKVDRQALLAQEVQIQNLEVAYVAPQNQLENQVAVIFQKSLGLAKVGINDNFFDLGGNSLLLAEVYRELLEVLPEKIKTLSLIDLFNYPTVSTLAQHLNQGNSADLSEQQQMALEQKLTQGKDRLKQRLKLSKRVQVRSDDGQPYPSLPTSS